MPQGDCSTTANKSVALSDFGDNGCVQLHSTRETSHGWVIDSGETNHMTFDLHDFIESTQSKQACIANANGVTYPVTGAGRNILTKEIIGRGTKRGELYYMDDFSFGTANGVHHIGDKERQLPRQKGDPHKYLHIPSCFNDNGREVILDLYYIIC